MRSYVPFFAVLTLVAAGCAATPERPTRPIPVGTAISASYDTGRCVAIIEVTGAEVAAIGVWYPGRTVRLDAPPWEVQPKAELVRFNLAFLEGGERSWALVTEHTRHESPGLFGPGIVPAWDNNMAVDMRPLIKSGCVKK